mmetsp:Transcript_59318/g.133616  ORF Transcript_59318/g.133616 Transcript_59318/m.133616 type:complete len:346 (+) Transcript_59318:83-1120(+)
MRRCGAASTLLHSCFAILLLVAAANDSCVGELAGEACDADDSALLQAAVRREQADSLPEALAGVLPGAFGKGLPDTLGKLKRITGDALKKHLPGSVVSGLVDVFVIQANKTLLTLREKVDTLLAFASKASASFQEELNDVAVDTLPRFAVKVNSTLGEALQMWRPVETACKSLGFVLASGIAKLQLDELASKVNKSIASAVEEADVAESLLEKAKDTAVSLISNKSSKVLSHLMKLVQAAQDKMESHAKSLKATFEDLVKGLKEFVDAHISLVEAQEIGKDKLDSLLATAKSLADTLGQAAIALLSSILSTAEGLSEKGGAPAAASSLLCLAVAFLAALAGGDWL